MAPEDGPELGDLRNVTRRLMAQMERDLETQLDWVAVDHHNTGHPHSHIVIRGVTDDGKILNIAGDYIAHGIRHRAAEIVTLELGMQSEWEVQQTLGREVEQGVIISRSGVGEIAIGAGFGVVTGWTRVGAVAGGAVTLHGLDVAQAALLGTDTFTSQGLQSVGLSRNTANAIDTGISGAAFIAAGAADFALQLIRYCNIGWWRWHLPYISDRPRLRCSRS